MVITPHALAGALAATAPKGPAAIFGAGTHLLLDRIPHHDYSISGRAGKARIAIDVVCAVALLRYSGATSSRQLMGAAAGIAPDLLVIAKLSGRKLPALLQRFSDAHDNNHTKTVPSPRQGWLAQVVVVGIIVAVLRSFASHADQD